MNGASQRIPIGEANPCTKKYFKKFYSKFKIYIYYYFTIIFCNKIFIVHTRSIDPVWLPMPPASLPGNPPASLRPPSCLGSTFAPLLPLSVCWQAGLCRLRCLAMIPAVLHPSPSVASHPCTFCSSVDYYYITLHHVSMC